MFLGHYGVAFGGKTVAPRPSLGTFILAAQLADLVWPILLLLGIERVRIVPGLMAASPMDFTYYPFTHSLVTQALAGAVFGAIYFALRKDGRGALILGLAVVSHWFLDLLVHRPDLPIWPGGPKVGLGLWNSVPLTLLAEALVFGGGLYLYLRATKARDRIGTWALWSLVGLLVLCYAGAALGPPPPGTTPLAISAVVLWLFVPWGYWIDRHRHVAPASPPESGDG
jgi:membrane-bound metal-dependent hydrolase YbcI (DUF457 family)